MNQDVDHPSIDQPVEQNVSAVFLRLLVMFSRYMERMVHKLNKIKSFKRNMENSALNELCLDEVPDRIIENLRDSFLFKPFLRLCKLYVQFLIITK